MGLGAVGVGSGQGKVRARKRVGPDVQLQCTLCTLCSLPWGWAPDPPCCKQTLAEERLFLQGL